MVGHDPDNEALATRINEPIIAGSEPCLCFRAGPGQVGVPMLEVCLTAGLLSGSPWVLGRQEQTCRTADAKRLGMVAPGGAADAAPPMHCAKRPRPLSKNTTFRSCPSREANAKRPSPRRCAAKTRSATRSCSPVWPRKSPGLHEVVRCSTVDVRPRAGNARVTAAVSRARGFAVAFGDWSG